MATTSGMVLIIDDDPDVRAVMSDVLADNGYLVAEASTGAAAWQRLTEYEPDVILLDLGLPDVSGLDVLIDLTRTSSIPVIIVTGRTGETDTVVGLDLGADDYINKPFSDRELVARVNAAVRRRRGNTPVSVMTFGPLTINEDTRDVLCDSKSISLTPKEFDLLSFLAKSPRRVYDRSQLLQHVWASSPGWQDDNTVAEHVYRLRRKLDPDHRSRWIETVRGVGYRFTGAS